MQHNHIVIMAGGIGSRFWPLSTPDFPKQFIDILGCGRTLIQLTVDRFQGVAPLENFWVVTNAKYVGIVQEQLPGIPAEHILAEPEARNTAPCIAWACWKIRSEDADANIVVTPSDAVVLQPEEFRRVIGNALRFTAQHDAVVTVGIRPSRPETGYGYVEVAPSCPAPEGHPHIRSVQQFREKPDRATAEQYLRNIHGKTAALFRTACTLGARESGLGEETVSKFGDLGERIGVMFQFRDDLLDFISTKEKRGKETRKDFLDGIYTMPVIYAAETNAAREELLSLMRRNREGTLEEKDFETVSALVQRYGVDRVREDIHRCRRESEALLDAVGDNASGAGIRELIGKLDAV